MSAENEIRFYDADGVLHRIVRGFGKVRPVTPEDVEAEIAAEDEEFRRGMERRPRPPPPENMPYFRQLMLDREGLLWIQDYYFPVSLPAASVHWTVLDSAGRRLAGIELPGGFHPFQIGEDFILGLTRKDLDVQHVQMNALNRGSAPQANRSTRVGGKP